MKNNLEKIIKFLNIVGKLKTTYRYGETASKKGDSSAAHSWRLALMIFILAKELKLKKLDILKAVKIALIHDLAEAITGDIDMVLIKEGIISKKEKHKNELQAINKIKKSLPGILGKEIHNLWLEYEKGKTKEAKFVKALDKLETLTQTIELGHKEYTYPEYIPNYADKAVTNYPELTQFLKILKNKLKLEFKKGNIPWKKEYEN